MDPTVPGMNALCAKDALTDGFGWTIQAVLASLAFACLICKNLFLTLPKTSIKLTVF